MDQPMMQTGAARVLELKLQQVRAAAAAARWEAEAAQLELLLLEALGGTADSVRDQGQPAARDGFTGSCDGDGGDGELDLQAAAEALILAVRQLAAGRTENLVSVAENPLSAGGPVPTAPQTADWHQRAGWQQGTDWQQETGWQQQAAAVVEPPEVADAAAAPATPPATEVAPDMPIAIEPIATGPMPGKSVPLRSAAAELTSEQMFGIQVSSEQLVSEQVLGEQAPIQKARSAKQPTKRPVSGLTPKKSATAQPAVGPKPVVAVPGVEAAAAVVTIVESNGPQDRADGSAGRRSRPAAWVVSSLAHIVALGLLSLVTLAAPQVRDQLAFTASAANASEELNQFATIELPAEPLEAVEAASWEESLDSPSPQLVQWDAPAERMISERMAASLAATAPPASPIRQAAWLMTSAEGSALGQPLAGLASAAASQSANPVQFAGIAGGGNHFVYLVDSSHSMLRFAEARAELLRSVDALQPDQRFYVVFYDEQPKYMCITHPGRQEAESVYATAANKQALRNWAMTIVQQRGQSPPDVLRFAFGLQPDVIFLLSDGQFSARTETVIREENRRGNLFGEGGPISIIHTIRFPGVSTSEGRNAEQQMQRIAQENGGQYRSVEF